MNLLLLDQVLCKDIEDYSQLSLSEFNYRLEQNDFVLVLFYSSNDQSKEAKTMNEAAHFKFKSHFKTKFLYKNYDNFLNFVTVDCERIGDVLCNAFSIIDKPEWVLFRFGTIFKRINLNTKMNKDQFIVRINDHIKSISRRFNSFTGLNRFLQKSKQPVVVGLFANINDRLSIDKWLSSVEKVTRQWNYRNILFCHIFKDYSNGSLTELEFYKDKSINNTDLPFIALVKKKEMIHKKEKQFLIYKLSKDKEDISEWLKRKVFGLLFWRSRDNECDLKLPLVVAYFNFDFENNYESSFKWRNIIYDLALNNLDLNFALSHSKTFKSHLEEYKLNVEDAEPLFIAYDLFNYPYLYNDVFSEYEFDEFLIKFRNNQLEPLVKQSSSYDLDSSIKELNSLTFSKYVLNSKKDVFILLYANWCAECTGSILALEEISQRITEEDEVVFAKMEGSENDLPRLFQDTDEFPTFYLFKADSKELIKSEINRNIISIINFLAENVSKELVHFDRRGRLRTAEEQKKIKIKLKNMRLKDSNLHIENVKNEL